MNRRMRTLGLQLTVLLVVVLWRFANRDSRTRLRLERQRDVFDLEGEVAWDGDLESMRQPRSRHESVTESRRPYS